MFAINILTLEKHFHNILHKNNAYNSHNIQNRRTRDGERKKNLLGDDLNEVEQSQAALSDL